MTEVPFRCGIGFAAATGLTAASTVDLSTVDGNQIVISGTTPINSFGTTPNLFRIVTFISATPLVDSNGLRLYTRTSRTTNPFDESIFISDGSGNWLEVATSPTFPLSKSLFGFLSGQAFTSSQTITIPTNATKAIARMWGGSGGSAGNTSSGSGAPGSLIKLLTGLTPGNTLIFTCGAAGAAGVGTGAGGNGTASTLASGTQTIGTLTANGSNGSASAFGSYAGGTATGGDFNMTGGSGSSFVSPDGVNQVSGVGGAGPYALGADGGGHAGNPGQLIIEWYT